MAPCHRCGVGTRSGRGQGWCSNPQCRQAEKEERLAQKSADKTARQQQRASQGAGSRGPLRRVQAEAEEQAGSRGPLREEGSKVEDEHEREEWNKAMEFQNGEPLANMTVKFLNMQGSEIHTSKPYPLWHVEPCESFQEAWLHTLHEGNNPDRCLSLHQLRHRRQETKKPIPAETLQYRSAREVLLHDLDSGPTGPIPLDTTKLVVGGDVITDAWSWRELSDRSDRSFGNNIVHVQVVYMSEKATDP